MTNLHRIETDEGSVILIETKSGILPAEVYQPGVTQTGAIQKARDKVVQEIAALSEDSIKQISKSIATFSKLVLSKFNDEFGSDRPSITIEFGVNVVGEVGIEIVKASGEGTLQVSVTWDKSK